MNNLSAALQAGEGILLLSAWLVIRSLTIKKGEEEQKVSEQFKIALKVRSLLARAFMEIS